MLMVMMQSHLSFKNNRQKFALRWYVDAFESPADFYFEEVEKRTREIEVKYRADLSNDRKRMKRSEKNVEALYGNFG